MPRKLLVADDSVTIQRVIELTFQDEDVDVVAVGDGRRAIERIQSDLPDIVLADIGMPEKDGYEVSAFVKQRAELKHIPVLLLTGAFEPVDERRARASGCDGVLVKPFEPQLVISRVRDLLSGRPQPAAWSIAQGNTPPVPAPESPKGAPWAVEDRRRAADVAPPGRPDTDAPAREAPRGDALDDYLDRLDAAFSTVTPSPAREGFAEMDRFDTPQGPPSRVDERQSAAHAWDPFLEDAPLAPSLNTDVPLAQPLIKDAPVAHPPHTPAVPTPFRMIAPPPAPAQGDPAANLADAFAALLAAEQGQSPAPNTAAQPVWRPTAQPAAPSASHQHVGADADALVEEVSRRVLERITERVIRDTVTDVTLKVAERLVREEIQKIKERAEGR